MLKILVSDDVILFIEHVVSFCACAMNITKYLKRAEILHLPEEDEEIAKITSVKRKRTA